MELEQKIKNVISSVLDVDVLEIDESTSPETIDSWDSLKHMNLILALEEEFGIEFNDEDIMNMTNYRLIYLIINEKLDEIN